MMTLWWKFEIQYYSIPFIHSFGVFQWYSSPILTYYSHSIPHSLFIDVMWYSLPVGYIPEIYYVIHSWYRKYCGEFLPGLFCWRRIQYSEVLTDRGVFWWWLFVPTIDMMRSIRDIGGVEYSLFTLFIIRKEATKWLFSVMMMKPIPFLTTIDIPLRWFIKLMMMKEKFRYSILIFVGRGIIHYSWQARDRYDVFICSSHCLLVFGIPVFIRW